MPAAVGGPQTAAVRQDSDVSRAVPVVDSAATGAAASLAARESDFSWQDVIEFLTVAQAATPVAAWVADSASTEPKHVMSSGPVGTSDSSGSAVKGTTAPASSSTSSSGGEAGDTVANATVPLAPVRNTTVGAGSNTPSKTILEELRELKPLPKVHYSWGLAREMLGDRDNEVLYELARITRSLSVVGESVTAAQIDNCVYVLSKINAMNSGIPTSIGVNYSPWHREFRQDLESPIPALYNFTIFNHPSYNAEIEKFVERLTLIRQWVHQSNQKYGSNIDVGAILLDCERFYRRDNDPYWNANMRKALDAIHTEAVALFPDARIEWFGRGKNRYNRRDYTQSHYYTGAEVRTTVSFSCYNLPDTQYVETLLQKNLEYADSFTPNVEELTPWVALASGYKGGQWMNDWDYGTTYSSQMGARLHRSDIPYSRVGVVVFYPRPFNSQTPAWGKHFVAYCKGTETSNR